MISSASNDFVKHIKKLQAKKSYRRETGSFVVEGLRLVKDGLFSIHTIVMSESFDASLIADLTGKETITVTDKVFKEISDTINPQGVMGIAKMCSVSEEDISGENPFIIFCDAVADPGNMGTIIRTADAVGASAVVLGSGCVDLYNPKTVRGTMSSLFNVKIIETGNSIKTLENFKNKGIKIFGTTPSGEKDIYAADFKGPVAVVIGNEANGICGEILDLCDEKLKIPMLGSTESLNASVAAAVTMYEVLRQRL
ncbi:MAG: RNA methyltransferase [Clostridia bacterium]|nr:RNA methyltransferase [Clostridia bacterium]